MEGKVADFNDGLDSLSHVKVAVLTELRRNWCSNGVNRFLGGGMLNSLSPQKGSWSDLSK